MSLNFHWFQNDQPSKLIEKNVRFSTLVLRHCVPHLKGLISGKVELKGQGLDTTFIMGHALLKKAILHL